MFTFDALGFSQVVFLLFLILGIGSAMAANEPEHQSQTLSSDRRPPLPISAAGRAPA